MFLSNFRVAIFWVMKQPLYYAVKVLGLAIGIMSLALLVTYVDFVGEYDAHIPARDQIYRVVAEYVNRESGAPVRPGTGSITWIEPFRNEYGDMFDSAGVLLGRNGVFAHETNVFGEEYYFADTEALELFNLELLEGRPEDAMAGPNKVLLSQSAAFFATCQGRSIFRWTCSCRMKRLNVFFPQPLCAVPYGYCIPATPSSFVFLTPRRRRQ